VRIGILGGSFDPVHHGHLLVARALLEADALDRVLLIPARTQPFKSEGHGAPAEARAGMVALAVEGEPGLALDRVEVDRAGPSYTVETLRILRARDPGADHVLFVGSDAAVDLPAWRESAVLRTLAEVVLFARAGAPVPELGLRAVTVPHVEISATAIRDRIRAGRSIRYLVPDAVAAYIAAHRLYLEEE
jgi:nicotinate-nucleotide adenylyltransferase